MRQRKIPGYLLHKPSGNARVRIDGRDHWLGKHGTPESHDLYDDLIAELVLNAPAGANGTVSELLAAWWRHCKTRYSRHGKGKLGNAQNWRPLIRFLRVEIGSMPARRVDAALVEAIRDRMPPSWSRQGVNQAVKRIRQIFKWAARKKLVPIQTYQAVAVAQGFRPGDSDRQEASAAAMGPVSDDLIAKTLPHLAVNIKAMVEIQRATGMRPGELVIMRPMDIDRSEDPWVYRPHHHKTAHHGKSRIIFLGPVSQAALMPYLLRPAASWCWPGRSGHYSVDSYRRAIHRACEARGLPRWSPKQIRKTKSVELRHEFDVETAAAVAGHSNSEVTAAHYAGLDMERARLAAKRTG